MAPIKEKMRRRSDALAGYRNIHHHALLFCNRLTCGLSRGLPICVMGYYCEWFYSNCLEDYLYREEQLIFPVVGYGSAEVKFSRACHVQIRQLFGERNKTYTNLAAIVSATASYIRFASLTLIPDAEACHA